MSGYMELSDGTSSVSFSPLVTPGIRRPDLRTRGHNQYDGGPRQYWDAEGAERHDFSLSNVSKAYADKLNEWWQQLTVLEFYADKDGAPSDFVPARINPAGGRPFQFMFGQTVDTKFDAVLSIIETRTTWALDLEAAYYAEAANNTIHDITTQDIGVSAWVKISSSASLNSRVLFKGGTGVARYDLVILTAGGGTLRFTIADSDVDEYKLDGNTDLRDDRWHHIAAIIDRNNAANCKIYLDGSEDGTTTKTGTLGDIGSLTNTDKLTIGAANAAGSSDRTTILEGEIRDVVLAYPADIIAANEMGASGEIANLYNGFRNPAGWPNSEDYWLCDEGTGTTLTGQNNNLTLSDAAAWI